MEKQKRCPKGYIWCPVTKKCKTKEEMAGKQQGRRIGRGQGQGPIGMPYKEAEELVDEILIGTPSSIRFMREVDNILDEVENELDNVPDQDIQDLYDDVSDELSKDEKQKQHKKHEEMETPEHERAEHEGEPSVEESMKNAVQLLVKEEDYREFFKGMLKKWNISSPSDLDGDKKKEFFNVVDKEWKAKKETD